VTATLLPLAVRDHGPPVRPRRASATLGRVDTAPVDDAALIAACAAGDERALAALYDRLASAAYGLALRIVRDPSLAEDAVQEAFLAVWRGAGTYSAARGRPTTWVLSLVHHKAVDLVRREEARPSDPSADIPERIADGDVVGAVLAAHDRAVIGRALAALSPSHRTVLELAYLDGLTQSELAERLGEPLGTIKSRTHAALARLRALLGPDGSRPDHV